MAKKIYKDSDILKAMATHLDEESVVYGANGHYGVGAYYDLTKVSSVLGDKDYNSQTNIDGASGTTAANDWRSEFVDDDLKDANWMKEY